MRYILEKNIYPRDLTLRLFDSLESQSEAALNNKYSFVQNNTDNHLLIAFNLLQKLNSKIK